MELGNVVYFVTKYNSGMKRTGIRFRATPEMVKQEFDFRQFDHVMLIEARQAVPTDVVRCGYCGSDVKLKDAYRGTYWSNGRQHEDAFCDKGCCTYRQMGAEG